jgi:hypothetical protein
VSAMCPVCRETIEDAEPDMLTCCATEDGTLMPEVVLVAVPTEDEHHGR